MSSPIDYEEFIRSKSQLANLSGFEPVWIPDWLFDFQAELVRFNLTTGRSATFADCGLGKGPMELVWGQNVVEYTGRPVLLAAPPAVSYQIVREAEKFGIPAQRSVGEVHPGINVTTYGMLSHFNPADFAGFIGDESSCIKSQDSVTRQEVTIFIRQMQYRLLSTATAAPNDYIEIGTHSEALGYLGYMDMLNRFFKNDLNNSATGRKHGHAAKWRFKGHAEEMFWRWVCSIARAVRRPSDLGYDDSRFALPPLTEHEHVVQSDKLPEGCLFALPAVGLNEQREERRRTIQERCEKVAEIANSTDEQVFIGCHLNPEGDLLEKLIPHAVQVSGRDSDEDKERKLLGFADGTYRVAVSKDKIAAYGLNLQNCHRVVRFPSHSFEAYYQFVRRCWRFGQQSPVTVDMVISEGDRGTLANLQRKAVQADRMFESLLANQKNALSIDRSVKFTHEELSIPWLS